LTGTALDSMGIDVPAGSQECLVDPVGAHGDSSLTRVQCGADSADATCLIPGTNRWPERGRNVDEEAREVEG
jgi:hypothetical protein